MGNSVPKGQHILCICYDFIVADDGGASAVFCIIRLENPSWQMVLLCIKFCKRIDANGASAYDFRSVSRYILT